MEMGDEQGNIYSGHAMLYGTNWYVGGYQIEGAIFKHENGVLEYDFTYTWNDIIDPNNRYVTDIVANAYSHLYAFLNPDLGLTLNNYNIHIVWRDVSIIDPDNRMNNSGWFKDYDSELLTFWKWYAKKDLKWWESIEKQQQERLRKFLEGLEKYKEEHPEYYAC